MDCTKTKVKNFRKQMKMLCLIGCIFLTGCTQKAGASEIPPESAQVGMKVHFLDVGQADCTLIQTKEEAMLIDAGNWEDQEEILTYLDSQGVEKLDYVIGTHPHEDHIGAMGEVIRQYEIGTLILPDKIHTTTAYEDMLEAAEEKDLSVTLAEADDSYELGENAEFTIVAPVKDYGDNLNNWSVGVRVTYGEDSFLFCGDAEAEAEADMRKTGEELEAEVWKVSHHGSSTSNTPEFLDAVQPAYGVISCGEDNSYGHPNQSVLEELTERGVEIYRTDEQGTIVASATGSGVTFSCEPSTSMEAGDGKNKSKAEDIQEETNPTVTEDANEEIMVHRTKTGKKYHREGCEYLQESDLELSLEEARELGLTPCRKCEPPQ